MKHSKLLDKLQRYKQFLLFKKPFLKIPDGSQNVLVLNGE